MLTIIRRLTLLASFAIIEPAHADALDFLIVASDGTPEREMLAVRAETEFLDAGYLPERVVRLREPSRDEWGAAFAQARAAAARDLFVLVLGDTEVGPEPKLALGRGRIPASALRAELDAQVPTASGRQIVVQDGNAAGVLLARLATAGLPLRNHRELYGSTNAQPVIDGTLRAHAYMHYWLTGLFIRPSLQNTHVLHQSAHNLRQFAVGYPAAGSAYRDVNGNGIGNETYETGLTKLTYATPIPDGPNRTDRAIVVATNDGSGIGHALTSVGVGMVRALKAQGLADDAITWLGNAPSNVITGAPDAAATRLALFEALVGASGADDVVVFLAGHGTAASVRINGTESVSYAELAEYFVVLQASISGRLTVVLDTCYAGGLIDHVAAHYPSDGDFFEPVLAASGTEATASSAILEPEPVVLARPTIITSARIDELAYFPSVGVGSFSAYWATRVAQGDYVDGATLAAARALEEAALYPQHALIDADADGIANEEEDRLLAHYPIFGATVAQVPAPEPTPLPPCTGCQ